MPCKIGQPLQRARSARVGLWLGPLLSAVLCLFPALGAAADLELLIPEETLNVYAAAIGTVTGTGTFAGTPALGENLLLPHGATGPPTNRWTWTVLEPRFLISPGGILFTAALFAEAGDRNTFIQHVQLPVQVRLDRGASMLRLAPARRAIPVFLSVDGLTRRVGGVDVGRRFEVGLPLVPASLDTPRGRLEVVYDQIGTLFLDGVLQATAEVSFR